MNSDGIRRSVRALRAQRSAGDSPNLGRLARMPGTGLPKGERRKRRKSESKRSGRLLRGRRRALRSWTILLLVVAVLMLGVALWYGVGSKLAEMNERDAESDQTETERVTLVVSKFKSPSPEEATGMVRKALAIRNPDEVATLIRPSGHPAAEIVEFLKGLQTSDGELESCEPLGSIDANGMQMEGVRVNYKSATEPRNRLALLIPEANGKWKMDFGAFARSVTPSWNEIAEGRANSAVVRVYIASDNYYNSYFTDDTQWVCYGMASPDTEEIFMGYCRRDSAQNRAIWSIMSRGGEINRVTLQLEHPAEAESRQFVIKQVLAEDWAMGDNPFDVKF